MNEYAIDVKAQLIHTEGVLMKNWRFLKNAGRFLSLLMVLFAMVSCADDIGDIDRTEPNKIKKSDLKGMWYYVMTVTEAPVPNPITFDGEMNFGGGASVIFDIQEEYLVAYPIAETIEGSEKDWHKASIRNYWEEGKSEEFIEMYVGQPLAAFEITSHFDVIRDYNPQTGEQSNIIVENDTDNYWYEREYIRVDWASNKIKDLLFMMGLKTAPVDYYVQEFEQDNPDAFEMDEDSINVVTKLFAEPVTLSGCQVYLVASYDCAGAVIKLRHSFLKVDPNNDYVPLYYPQGSREDKYGFFLTERDSYDPDHGIKYSDTLTLINRFNLWENSRTAVPLFVPGTTDKIMCREDIDCEGAHDGQVHCWLPDWFEEGYCVTWDSLPYNQRTPKPIVYHVSTAWPEEVWESIYKTADGWSLAFKETVAWMQLYAEKGLYDMKYCETDADCGGDFVLDKQYSDKTPRFCDPAKEAALPPELKVCNLWVSQSQWPDQYCSQVTGTCASSLACGPGQACPAGQACFSGICNECSKDSCSHDDKADGWVTYVNERVDRGAFTLYYLVEDGKETFRRSGDGPVAFLDDGTAQVNFVHVAKGVGTVKLMDNTGSTCKVNGKDAEYNFESAELIRTRNCVVPLNYTDEGTQTEVRNFSVVDVETGKTLATLNFGTLTNREVTTLVLVGNAQSAYLLHGKETRTNVNTGGQMRFVHGAPGKGPVDFSLNASRRAAAAIFGTVTSYSGLAEDKNRVMVLPAGTNGEVSCFHDSGIGMCMGWRNEFDDTDMKRYHEIYNGLPEMFVICENMYTGASCTEAQRGSLDQLNDCRYFYTDSEGNERNPCAEVIKPEALKKHGDIRWNSFYWIAEDQTASPLGYGPSAADPFTGEIYYGIANIYGGAMISYGQYAKDLLDLAYGDKSKEDIGSSAYIRDFVLENTMDGTSESLYAALDMNPASLEALKKARPPVGRYYQTPQELMEVKNMLQSPQFQELMSDRKKFLEFGVNMVPASMSEGELRARFNKIQGTWLEGLLINEEVKLIGSEGSMNPEKYGIGANGNALSPVNWAGPDLKRKYAERINKLAKNNFYASELVEPYVLGTAVAVREWCENPDNAARYGGVQECHVWRITKLMLDGVLEHEVGHTVGLRHNFKSSVDVLNYKDDYFAIRKMEHRKCFMEGPGSCAFGYTCKIYCDSDADCVPGETTCEELTVEGGGVEKLCVDKMLDPTGHCWGRQKKYADCITDSDCTDLGDSYCGRGAEERYGYCMVPEMAKGGICPPGRVKIDGADGALCMKNDYCEAKKCMFNSAKTCEDDLECQKVYVPHFVEPEQMEPVKTFVARGPMYEEETTGETRESPFVYKMDKDDNPVFGKYEVSRNEYSYASIMDYGGTVNFDLRGLGKYDKAAIKFGYGELVEIYTDPHKLFEIRKVMVKDWGGNELTWAGWLTDTLYLGDNIFFSRWMTLTDFIGVRENMERIPAPYRKVELQRKALNSDDRRTADFSYFEVPYIYRGDEWRGNYETYIFDVGADIGEIIYHSWNKLREYYIWDAFKRERFGAYQGGNPLGYYTRILDRWFPPLQDAGRFYAFYFNIFRDAKAFRNQLFSDMLMWGPMRQASEEALHMLSTLTFSPSPGSYKLEEDGNGNKRYVNIDYKTGHAESDLDIPIGVGKFPYTTYWDKAGYYYFEHAAFIGSFWEKLAALETMTFSLAQFISDSLGEQVDVGVGSSMGFNTNFYTELTNLIAGYVVGDESSYAPFVQADGTVVGFDPVHPWRAAGKPRVQTSLEGLSMKTYAGWYGFAFIPANFETGFMDSMFLCLEGNGSCYDVMTEDQLPDEEDLPAGMYAVEVSKYTDPWSLKTYVAKTANYDENRVNATYGYLQKANAIKAQWEAIELGDSEESDMAKEELGAQLREMADLLDVIYTYNELFGILHY